MKPIDVKTRDSIVNNIAVIKRTKDMELLNRETYAFVNILSGFIAHYDIFGFITYYAETDEFIDDLRSSYDIVHRERYLNDRFFSEGENAEYYRCKYDVLNRIATVLGVE